jgi:TRAP-type C4-dicarboxylate transport system substrate-binding protein
MTEHLYLAAPLIFSKKKFAKLPTEIQEAVLKAGRASVNVQRRSMEEKNEQSLVALRELGLIFNEVDGDKFREKIAEGRVYQRNAEHVGGEAMIDEVINQ